MHVLLLDVRQHIKNPPARLIHAETFVRVARPRPAPTAGRKVTLHVVMVLKTKADLLEVILALRAAGGFPRGLHGRQQQCYQDADDRDDHQQFDQCKAGRERSRAARRSGS